MTPRGYLQSRTVWGLLVLATTTAAQALWPDLTAGQVETLLTHLADAAGFLLAAYGTVRRPDLSGLWRPRQPAGGAQ